METAVIALSIILYIVMGIIVGIKQYKVLNKSDDYNKFDAEASGTILGFIWPITLTWYIIRVIFFEDWI